MPASVLVQRVLDGEPIHTLDDYRSRGGGRGLEAAAALEPNGIVEHLDASGLRGRGGAGFPTGRKWRTIVEHGSPVVPSSVVVNGAEGEPGSFKDRELLRRNPYRTLEGALIAAMTIGASRVVVALKGTFEEELARVRAALEEVRAAGWAEGIELSAVGGPSEYLYGEETALLEVLDGRHPFPRIAPPFRHGEVEVGDGAEPATVEMADPDPSTVAPPTLVNNVETLAHVALILANGPDWFRELGTAGSPGSLVCTVSGWSQQAGVGEVPMGTPLDRIIEAIGGGPAGARIVAVLPGVSHAVVPAELLDTPLDHESMAAIGSGVGAGAYIVVDDTVDPVALAQGVSRFLAIESCGQCTPCKQDGLALAERLERLCRAEPEEDDLAEIESLLGTVGTEARCALAGQHEVVVSSLLRCFPDAFRLRAVGDADPVEPELVAPVVAVRGDQGVDVDVRQRDKQPDWTYDQPWSGRSPADLIDDRADLGAS